MPTTSASATITRAEAAPRSLSKPRAYRRRTGGSADAERRSESGRNRCLPCPAVLYFKAPSGSDGASVSLYGKDFLPPVEERWFPDFPVRYGCYGEASRLQ